MREASPHSKIIWYDAVTIQGRLAWQNTLNWRNRLAGPQAARRPHCLQGLENGAAACREREGGRMGRLSEWCLASPYATRSARPPVCPIDPPFTPTCACRPFFDACDAIWINYTWRRGTPAAVRREVRVGCRLQAPPMLCSSACGSVCCLGLPSVYAPLSRISLTTHSPAVGLVQAGERAVDVYMGVDCFGRGTFGGGGFACDVALRACLDQGLSGGWPMWLGGLVWAFCWTGG